MNEWNKKNTLQKVWEKNSSNGGSDDFRTKADASGIGPMQQTTGNIITDIASGVIGTIMGMSTPVERVPVCLMSV